MEQKPIILLGMGGHAKVVVDTIEQNGDYDILGFVDVKDKLGMSYGGYTVIGTDDNLDTLKNSGGGRRILQDGITITPESEDSTEAFVSLGYIGGDDIRVSIYERLINIGYHLPVITDITATVAGGTKTGEGTYIGKRAVINPNTSIGKMCIINTGAIIEHDCIIGDYTHISVGAVICGGCSVGTGTFVGANSTVIQGISVGNNVIIGAGATVLHNVPDNAKVVGVF